jgi:hypothetical protein
MRQHRRMFDGLMMKGILFVALIIVSQLSSAEMREIVLKDGSILTGTVRSFDGDIYVIESDSLGTVSLDNSKIQAIRSVGEPAAAAATAQGISPQELLGIQQQLMNDGEIMDMIKALQTDPQIQAILNDPELLEAVASGDVPTLMNNPKFKALMDNPKIKEISNKVQP